MWIEPGTCNTSSGLDSAVFDHRGRGDDLVHRAGFERRGHRQVAQLPVALAPDVLGRVEGVVVGHGQHLAGLRVQHHGRDVVRPGQVLGLLHLLLHVELDVVVEGELDRRTVDRLVPVAVAARDDDAVGPAVVGDRAVGSGQRGVQRLLEAQQPVAVPVDAADDVGRQRSARILPEVLPLGTDLGVLGRRSRRRRRDRRHAPGRRSCRCSAASSARSAASGLLFSRAATSLAMSCSRRCGSGAAGFFFLASSSCVRILLGWKVSARDSMVKASWSLLRSTMLPRTAFATSVTLSCPAAWARRAARFGHLQDEQLHHRDHASAPKMTALPARCRNTNDAPRVPASTSWRVRRSRAE